MVAVPAAFSIIATLRYFDRIYFPTLDTGWYYQSFAYALGELRATGQLPGWVPESNYGMTSDFLLVGALGPSQYLFLLIGLVTKISSLNLFLASLALDQFIFLFGVALLCWHLFKPMHLITIYCVASCALVSILDNQLGFNFKIYQVLPLAFYLVLIGIERGRVFCLLCSLALLLAFEFGNIPYTLPLQFYCLVLFGILYLATGERRRDRLITLVRSLLEPLNIVPLAGMVFFAGMLAYLATRIQTEMIHADVSRSASLSVDIETYLSYGGYTGGEKLFELVSGATIHPRSEILGFFGVTGLTLLIFAIFVERSRAFLCLLSVFLFVLLFSVRETQVAHFVYYLPGMDRFRHIAYVLSATKWLGIVCAGFGLRHIAKQSLPSRDFFFLLAALAIVSLALFVSISSSLNQGAPVLFVSSLRSAIFLMLFFGIVLCAALVPIRESRVMFVGLAVLELVLYRLYLPFPTHVEPSARIEFANAAPRSYQQERIWQDESPKALEFQKETGLDFEHDIETAFLGIDLCGGSRSSLLYRSIIITRPVQTFLLTWKGAYEPSIDNNYRLLSILGCHTPKLRFVRNPSFAADATAAEAIVRRHPDLYGSPIVIAAQGDDIPSNDSGDSARSSANSNSVSTDIWSNATTNISRMDLDPSGRASLQRAERIAVKQFHANSITIDVNNPYPYAVWLVYADSYHEAWRALLDNAPVSVSVTNLAFKGLRITSGAHEVVFSFSRGPIDYLFFAVGLILILSVAFICIVSIRQERGTTFPSSLPQP